MTTEERLTALERKLAYYDTVVGRLVKYAESSAKGRMILFMLGVRG